MKFLDSTMRYDDVMARIIAGCVLGMLVLFGTPYASADMVPTHLRCEYRRDPLGIDVTRPRLSWILTNHPNQSISRGQLQTAYQILVASSPYILSKNCGDLWDSGKVQSNKTIQMSYRGASLTSAEQVFWKVRIWNEQDTPSSWSSSATWTMGLLNSSDWHAQWIGAPTNWPTVALRHFVTVRPELKRALVYVCGLGQYEMLLDSRKVGNDLLTPGWTDYRKTCLNNTYDITSLLHLGTNEVALLLGNGMYNVTGKRYAKFTGSFGPLKAIVQLRLEYTNGTTTIVGTDSRWQTSPGPITFSSIYGGEDYDACWQPHWQSAVIMPSLGGRLRGTAYAAPPIRAFEVLKPVHERVLSPGTTVYDLGQNASLMPRIVVAGPRGSSVRITPSELIKPSGQIDDTVCRGDNYWQYTLAGRGRETWFPKFYYRGCRYLKVQCKGGAKVRSIEGVVVHSSSKPVGRFSCSNELFNRIDKLVRWAQLNNMVSILTDCPTREKLGWLEQDYLNGPSLRYDFDMAPLFSKIENDMGQAQLANGLVPNIAPEYVEFKGGWSNPFNESPEWGAAFILVPWQQYEFDGDRKLLRRHYAGMKRYVAYLGRQAKEDLLDYGLGDWFDLGPGPLGAAQLTPKALTATATYYADVTTLAKVARVLRHTGDAKHYSRLAGEIRSAFNAKFFRPDARDYATGSQTANAMPLALGLVESNHRESVLDALVRNVQKQGLTAGDIGYRYLLRALAENGRSDVIYDLNNQTSKPGYGYQLKRGATSLTEAWDANRGLSQDHFMLGQIVEWFYHDLAGIQCDTAAPAFKKIIIKPAVVGELKWVKARYDSPHGRIISEWRRTGDQLRLRVSIPPNTTATVYVPSRSASRITEGGQLATHAPDVKLLRAEDGIAVFAIGSGTYHFATELP